MSKPAPRTRAAALWSLMLEKTRTRSTAEIVDAVSMLADAPPRDPRAKVRTCLLVVLEEREGGAFVDQVMDDLGL